MISLVSTSSGFCVSPCTLTVSSDPWLPPSAPFAATALIVLIAAATSTSNAARALLSGEPLSCSIRNFDSVVRPCDMSCLPDSRICGAGAGAITTALEYATGANVLGCDRHEAVAIRSRASACAREQPTGLAQARAVEGVAHRARIGEVRLRDAQCDVLAQRRKACRVEAVVDVCGEQLRDLHQLVYAVIGKIQMMRDTRRHAGIAAEKGLHARLVAGQDDDEVIALVFHHLQQNLDDFLPVVALVLGPIQVISLVDEKHTAHRAFEHVLGFRRGMTDVLTDEVIARDRDHMVATDVTKPVQDLGHAHRHGGLARARVAGKAHVQAWRARAQAQAAARLVDEQQRGDLADARLHRSEPDEFGIELSEYFIDTAVPV